jgi:hypothetical protein
MLKLRLFLLMAFLLVAVATRLFAIQAQSIWFDEGWSAYAAEQPTLVDAAAADATNPPLYYVLLNISARGFGSSELALRYVSLLLGLLTIPLAYQLAQQAATPRAGLYAALLAMLSAPLWWAAQEARMYTLLAVLILVCALAWQRLTTHPTRAAWLALWLGELALLYAHNTGPVAALWLNAALLLFWLAYRPTRKFLVTWCAGQVAVGLLWLPYFVTRFLLLQDANSAITAAPQVGLVLLGQVWQGLWIAPWALAVTVQPGLIVLSALVGLVTLGVFIRFGRQVVWLVVHTLILTAALLAGLIVLGNELHGRYLVMIVPLLLAAVGVGLARLRWRWLRFAALVPFVLLFALDFVLAQNRDFQHDDVRGMVQFYAEHLTAADSVVAWSYADRYDLAYYWQRLGVQARRVTLPEGADLEAVLPLLPASGDVALNVWYTQRADYRGMMSCLLAQGTVDAPLSFTTYGMTTLVYDDPALAAPAFNAADVTFADGVGNAVARLDAVGQVTEAPSDRALCLPLRLTLLRDIGVDLKAAVMVQNALGWTVASTDAVFATADQRTSAALGAGETLTAFPLLRLPYGAPPGTYSVFVRLYDQTDAPSGYTPQSGDVVNGRDVRVATWVTTAGADWAQVNRSTDLPNARNMPAAPELTLLADNLPSEPATVPNGDVLRFALLWQGAGALPVLELSDDAGAWRVEVAPPDEAHDDITLDWREAQIPAGAVSGTATLRLPDGTVLAQYLVEALPMLTSAPEFAVASGIEFSGVGTLVGYTLNDAPFSRDHTPEVALVWQAGAQTPNLSYTATVQLVDAAGQVIAQSDAVPGGRETTGWRVGEYILDRHVLAFNERASTGTPRLIVALYDVQTGVRVRLADGTDAAELQAGIAVE